MKLPRSVMLGAALLLAVFALLFGGKLFGGKVRELVAASTASDGDDAVGSKPIHATSKQSRPALRGLVRAAAGAPVANAMVCMAERDKACCEICVQTDSTGSFAFDAIEHGHYKLYVSADQYKPSARDLLLEELAGEDEYAPVELELMPGGVRTSGKVVDAF